MSLTLEDIFEQLHQVTDLDTETYTVQDTEDEYNRLTNVSYESAYKFVISHKTGTFSLTNDHSGIASNYIRG